MYWRATYEPHNREQSPVIKYFKKNFIINFLFTNTVVYCLRNKSFLDNEHNKSFKTH